ncbi:hypothetical protein Nwi_0540 [Nitrobacter winogradskyi Nb-255]|uniref:Uncharacterized protein n=1 Tax=Nitrobacter winogradskyi (strain ATCC 25391 / DSM 10237 / CIP 104748 / NCIMB 11846 / Nb-255) TaxID=323098 RepID=Q3SV84_NITWN|nr:hypothetical protein [Nitrobacter winogradskyi]ABA03807.1 hypothetical protein Nwi_0540 [Nitrobacter winogradskyi Nb-255]
MLTRRAVVASLAANLFPPIFGRTSFAVKPRPLVGAIRWDAWYSPGSAPTEAVENSLSPEKYRWRAPFFARGSAHDPASLSFPPITPEEMDKEIRQAAFAGLDYWAFVAYGSHHPMSKALYQFRASAESDKLGYCLFTELDRWGSRNKPTTLLQEHIGLMADRNYLRVSGDRPLYFLGFIAPASIERNWKGVAGLREQIEKFRSMAAVSGLADPYIVLAGDRNFLMREARNIGGDATGSYALTVGNGRGSFSDLTRIAERGWNELGNGHLPVVPTVMTGWDRRPRIENPVPWEKKQRPGEGIENFFAAPTKKELADHLARALDWVGARPQGEQAPVVLIYAWNENDEGGWLMPTLPCQTDRLDALRQVLKKTAAPVRKPELC